MNINSDRSLINCSEYVVSRPLGTVDNNLSILAINVSILISLIKRNVPRFWKRSLDGDGEGQPFTLIVVYTFRLSPLPSSDSVKM